jgi:hypothetical protein
MPVHIKLPAAYGVRYASNISVVAKYQSLVELDLESESDELRSYISISFLRPFHADRADADAQAGDDRACRCLYS